MTRVVATDHDDPEEGDNAKVTFSLEKNAIDESTGRPIFAIDSELGVITTALCCLDREKTQRYVIQVVATDGGGLKGECEGNTPFSLFLFPFPYPAVNLGAHAGLPPPPGTGTVVVDVDDVNDVPPRFSRPEWTLDVSESLDPDNVLATLTVVDQDVTNDFAYRVSSNPGPFPWTGKPIDTIHLSLRYLYYKT